MIEQQGKVIHIVDEMAFVQLGGTSGCATCDAGRGCGAGVFGRFLKKKPVCLGLENTVSAVPGQPVMVGIPEAVYLRLVLNLYLWPLLAGVVGAVFGHYLSIQSDAGTAVSDLAALSSGVAFGLVALWYNRSTSRSLPESGMVQLLRVIEPREFEN